MKGEKAFREAMHERNCDFHNVHVDECPECCDIETAKDCWPASWEGWQAALAHAAKEDV